MMNRAEASINRALSPRRHRLTTGTPGFGACTPSRNLPGAVTGACLMRIVRGKRRASWAGSWVLDR